MSSLNLITFFCLFLKCCSVIGYWRVDPLVNTKVGLIRGVKASDGDYSMFLGIPYARVNESNPFGPSLPYPNFENTFEAYDDSTICPQVGEFSHTVTGSLDCLHLNVYVPNSAGSNNLLPVLVWIYGGAFLGGSSGRYVHGPKYLVKRDVIFVTLNYRVGPYGFMCLHKPEVPGNQGLKDQRSALKWINENIEAFGGNPNKITIFGESAGAGSVDLHYLYTQDRLFHNVIMQSGTALYSRTVNDYDRQVPLKLAKYLGFSTEDIDEALQYLATVDTNLVIIASTDLNLQYSACVEIEIEGVDSLITIHPLEIKEVKNIPVLLGYNSDEFISLYHSVEIYALNNYFRDTINDDFAFNSSYLDVMEELVRHFYTGDDMKMINDASEEIKDKIWRSVIDFVSDYSFIYPAQRIMKKYYNNGASKIFQYLFSYNGDRNYAKRRSNISVGGAAHADELGYLFDVSFFSEEPTPEDQLMIDRMTSLWTNFAKNGDPTPRTNDLLPVKWLPITSDFLYCLDIDRNLTLLTRPYKDRMAFWELFYKLNEEYQKGYKDNSQE